MCCGVPASAAADDRAFGDGRRVPPRGVFGIGRSSGEQHEAGFAASFRRKGFPCTDLLVSIGPGLVPPSQGRGAGVPPRPERKRMPSAGPPRRKSAPAP